MFEIANVPFQKQMFLSILNIQTQEIFVSPKSICELFEISWNSQHSKLLENSKRWKYQTIMLKLPRDDRKRKLGVLPEKKVRSWICSINPEKVKPEIRDQLIAFQDECDEVLHNYWTKGIAVNPRYAPELIEKILNRIEKMEENDQKLSLQMNALAQEFIKMNERITILESKVDSMMEARNSFDERHWLFGKFVEIIAHEIDFNRNEIKKIKKMQQVSQKNTIAKPKKPAKKTIEKLK